MLLSEHLVKIVADFLIPLARRLTIRDLNHVWKVKYILTRCSSKLEDLTLDVGDLIPGDGEVQHDEPKLDEVLATGAQLKSLSLSFGGNGSESTVFWTWLWRHCTHVKRLQVISTNATAHNLAGGILSHMTKLERIELGSETFAYQNEEGYAVYCMELEDEHVAAILAACRRGLKAVEVRSSATFGAAAWTSLVNHFSSLEEMVVLGGVSLDGNDLRQILSSCPNLRTLVTIDDESYQNSDNFRIEMFAEQFVDLDQATGELNPWACESSLKVLKVLVTNLSDNIKCYRSASQNQVYRRLSRFINLETLWLGHDPHILEELRSTEAVECQDMCLQMSLESGLDMLQGLSALQELSVSNMYTMIGCKELQWMTQHWPRLRIIMGMDERGRDKEAAQWLQDHSSKIKLRATWKEYSRY